VSYQYRYDSAGRRTEVKNSFGEVTRFTYDKEGKLADQKNHNGTQTTYAYDEARDWVTLQLHQGGGGSLFEGIARPNFEACQAISLSAYALCASLHVVLQAECWYVQS